MGLEGVERVRDDVRDVDRLHPHAVEQHVVAQVELRRQRVRRPAQHPLHLLRLLRLLFGQQLDHDPAVVEAAAAGAPGHLDVLP